MFEPNDACRVRSIATDDHRQDSRRGWVAARRVTLTLILGLAAGLALGACAIPFGNGTESTDRSPEERRRYGNRLYVEEQERMERERTFDRVGPASSDR